MDSFKEIRGYCGLRNEPGPTIELTPSLCMIAARCVCTVFTLIPNNAETSLLLLDSARS